MDKPLLTLRTVKPAIALISLLALALTAALTIFAVSAYQKISDSGSYAQSAAQKVTATVVGGEQRQAEGRIHYSVVPAQLPDGEVISVPVGDDILALGTEVELWTAPVGLHEVWLPKVALGREMSPMYDKGTESTYSRTEFEVVERGAVLDNEFEVIITMVAIGAAAISYLILIASRTFNQTKVSSTTGTKIKWYQWLLFSAPWLALGVFAAALAYPYFSRASAEEGILVGYLSLAVLVGVLVAGLGTLLLLSVKIPFFAQKGPAELHEQTAESVER